ncbi:hypothetical protein BCF59_0506 [Mycoplasmopsis mustelae]|uniref:Uncharacterized protein n=1 Tax=Mycoplasmopsis mustelae TaxID=171289 RepID=A0A4R7UC65_9BACT|nr:hypothetical protein [Mycoplasmopsis mustelae]TDV23517.1 hypothetical protein BCF59_0506 [Mycoplasmopsis mustelae]
MKKLSVAIYSKDNDENLVDAILELKNQGYKVQYITEQAIRMYLKQKYPDIAKKYNL